MLVVVMNTEDGEPQAQHWPANCAWVCSSTSLCALFRLSTFGKKVSPIYFHTMPIKMISGHA